jgi:RNA polymerase sigma-70 factor, ECF subfamily
MSRKIPSRHSGVRCSTNRQRFVASADGRFPTPLVLRRAGSPLVEFLRSVTASTARPNFAMNLRANVLRNLAQGEQLRSIGNERNWLTCWRLHYGPKVASSENRRSRMPNQSSSVTFSRRISAGAAAQPLSVLRVRKRSVRAGSCMLGSCEPNLVVKARPEVPGTDAFERMFVESRRQFVAMAYSILRNTEDAEDAVQSAFVSGYLHLRDFQGRSALKTWLTRVVLNAALMIRRKRRTGQPVSAPERSTEEGEQWVHEIPSPEPDPETSCAKAEALGLIEELTAELTPTLREAFSMYYTEEMSVPQARLIAGVTTSTFKARLFRARRQVMRGAKRGLLLTPKKRMSDGFSLSAVSLPHG